MIFLTLITLRTLRTDSKAWSRPTSRKSTASLVQADSLTLPRHHVHTCLYKPKGRIGVGDGDNIGYPSNSVKLVAAFPVQRPIPRLAIDEIIADGYVQPTCIDFHTDKANRGTKVAAGFGGVGVGVKIVFFDLGAITRRDSGRVNGLELGRVNVQPYYQPENG